MKLMRSLERLEKKTEHTAYTVFGAVYTLLVLDVDVINPVGGDVLRRIAKTHLQAPSSRRNCGLERLVVRISELNLRVSELSRFRI
jgi:hypothetical protein